jgi:putative ABC transport system permease protein
MALGSGRNRVVTLVMREGMLLAPIGLGLGLCGAYFVGRTMQSILFGVRTYGPTGTCLSGTDFAADGVACLRPARRAAKVEPMQALRTE